MDDLKDTARKEKCPKCGSTQMCNNHYLQNQTHDRVFVECAHCGHLVAKYILRNYLDPDFHYKQFLKLAKIHQEFSSGRKTLEQFQNLQERARTQFERIQVLLNEGEQEEELSLQNLLSKYHILEDTYQAFDE